MKLFLIVLACCSVALAPLPALADDTLKVIIVDGDEAANIVAERIAAEPVVEVRDREDRRVANAVVRFLIRRTARNRLATVFRNGQSEVRTLTDASGRASVNLSPVEAGSFEIEVEASYQGQTGKAVIRHTNYPTTADAKAAGREPGKSTSQNAQASSGGTTASGASGAGAATASTTAPTASAGAVSAGAGVSKLAVIGLVAGGAAGAGAAVVLSQKGSESGEVGRVTGLTASVSSGIQSATAFAFSVQAAGFDQGSIRYRWEFGDGTSSTEPAPTHVYTAPGAYTVSVTVSDARQSAHSETAVTVHTVTGTWTYLSGRSGENSNTIELTQSGSTVTGVGSFGEGQFPPWTPCALDGTVRAGAPALVLNQPTCRHPEPFHPPLTALEYRLDLTPDGQSLTGTRANFFGDQGPTVWRRR